MLQRDLQVWSQSAIWSLAEGLEETLTFHQIEAFAQLGTSFKTINFPESTNALVEE